MYKVLLAGIVHQAGRDLLAARGDVEHAVLEDMSRDALAERIAELDAVIVRLTPIDAAMAAAAKKLKVVSRFGVGYDAIDVPALTRAGIPLTVVGEANAVTVAEHALGLMIAITRQMAVCDRAVRAGDYGFRDAADQMDLYRKTVLIVGFGRIGQRVATRCAAFEMDVIVADPYAPRDAVEAAGYRYVADFHEALGAADFVTLHMPANADGRPVMGAAEFQAIKPGAYLINVARGSLLDEDALAAALTSGRVKGAGLDVLRQEPPAPDCPLLALDNVILTPHSAALTEECNRRMSLEAAQNALDGLDGKLRPAYVINKEVLG